MPFPPEWRELCAVFTNRRAMWNIDHPVVQAVDRDGWDWILEFVEDGDPRPYKKEILSKRSRCAAWVLSCVNAEKRETFWNGLRDHESAFLKNVWSKLHSSGKKHSSSPIRVWYYGSRFGSSTETAEISSRGITILERAHSSRMPGVLNFPNNFSLNIPSDENWLVNVIPNENNATVKRIREIKKIVRVPSTSKIRRKKK